LRTLRFAIAEDLDSETGPVPEPVTISIDKKIPESRGPGLADMEDFFHNEAIALALVLFYSLPQGTYDKLIIELMKRKVSVYRGLTRS